VEQREGSLLLLLPTPVRSLYTQVTAQKAYKAQEVNQGVAWASLAVPGIAQSMNSETPKKSPLLTSVNKGKKKGQSHYAYYTPTQRTSKREGYWTKQIGTGT